MRTIRALALAMLMALTVSAALAADDDASALATPEEAVRAYLEGVAGADVEAILATAAVDEVAEGYRFDRYVDRLGRERRDDRSR